MCAVIPEEHLVKDRDGHRQIPEAVLVGLSNLLLGGTVSAILASHLDTLDVRRDGVRCDEDHLEPESSLLGGARLLYCDIAPQGGLDGKALEFARAFRDESLAFLVGLSSNESWNLLIGSVVEFGAAIVHVEMGNAQ
jgi:hypothetical protein